VPDTLILKELIV